MTHLKRMLTLVVLIAATGTATARAQYPGRLGVELSPVDGTYLGPPFSRDYRALWVRNVLPGSAAQRACLLPGDVIVAANNQLTPATASLSRIVAGTYSALYLVVYRRGPAGWQSMSVVVALPPAGAVPSDVIRYTLP